MQWSAERVLVLGADGFLGRHTLRMLQQRGASVIPVCRAAGDFSDRQTVEQIFKATPKVTRIFHLITCQRTGQSQIGLQGELLAINARIHLNVLEAWRIYQPQAKLISTGSSCAYPEYERAMTEDDFQSGPMHTSVRGYGLAKQLLAVGSETYAAQYDLNYLHLFLATIYGPSDHKAANRSHFMTGMIDRAVREMRTGNSEFTVWGDPATVRDLLYVDDQIEAIFAADAAFENVRLNCAANNPVTIDTCALAVRGALGWNAEIIYPEGTFKGTKYKTLDSTAFHSRTSWTPAVTLDHGVSRVLNQDYGITRKLEEKHT